jgi:hypothetical protein
MTTRELWAAYQRAREATDAAKRASTEAWRKLCRYGHTGAASDERLQTEYAAAKRAQVACEHKEHVAYMEYHAAVTRERQLRGATPQGV